MNQARAPQGCGALFFASVMRLMRYRPAAGSHRELLRATSWSCSCQRPPAIPGHATTASVKRRCEFVLRLLGPNFGTSGLQSVILASYYRGNGTRPPYVWNDRLPALRGVTLRGARCLRRAPPLPCRTPRIEALTPPRLPSSNAMTLHFVAAYGCAVDGEFFGDLPAADGARTESRRN